MLSEFYFYTSYVEWARKALTGDLFYMLLEAIIYYGTTGTCEIESPVVVAVFTQMRYSINASKQRYERAKTNGAKGGRPSVSTRAEIRLFIFEMIRKFGCVTYKDLVDYYGCSKRTVLRMCSKEYIESLIKEMEDRFWIYQNKGGGYSGIIVRFYAVYFLDQKKYEMYINRNDALEEMEGHPCTWTSVYGRGEALRWANGITELLSRSAKIPEELINIGPPIFEGREDYMVSMAYGRFDSIDNRSSELYWHW